MRQFSSRQIASMVLGFAAMVSGCAGQVDDTASADFGDDAAYVEDAEQKALGDEAAYDDEGEEGTGLSIASLTKVSSTLKVSGRQILDTCGQPFAARGMEQLTGRAFSKTGTYDGISAELIKTGSNAVRILPQIGEMTASDVDRLLGQFEAAKVVVYISPGDRTWFNRTDIKPVLLRHEKTIILDAFQEPNYDDVARWVTDSKNAIKQVRSYGYKAPVTVLSNLYGRDLKALLSRGQEIVDSDPLRNTIMGWQAYWGVGGWYQKTQGMSLTQGVDAAALKNFPVQMGIDLNADPNQPMNYSEVMAAAQRKGMSWLWWNFWNKWDGMNNNASLDGSATNLTASGKNVVTNDVNSIQKTAKKACFY